MAGVSSHFHMKDYILKLNEKRILTDVDGVMLNWVDGFEKFMNDTHNLKTIDDSDYSLAVRFGVDPAKEYDYIVEFNHSEAISRLEPLRDAKEVVEKFTDAGYKFVVITSLSKNDSSCDWRVQNLERVFGKDTFEDFVFLDIGESKVDALSKFAGSGLTWIEDLPKNALDGHNIGLPTYVMKHTYNADFNHDEMKFVDTWGDIHADFFI